jgi:hypothetical protein
MNKSDLVASMASAAEISKADAEKSLNGALSAITSALPSLYPKGPLVQAAIPRPVRPSILKRKKSPNSKQAASFLQLSNNLLTYLYIFRGHCRFSAAMPFLLKKPLFSKLYRFTTHRPSVPGQP